MGYRNRLEILADMLYIAIEDVVKTRIMVKANLSTKLLEKYLLQLTDAGLIIPREGSRYERYETTPKGKSFLKRFELYSKNKRIIKKLELEIKRKKEELEEMLKPVESL